MSEPTNGIEHEMNELDRLKEINLKPNPTLYNIQSKYQYLMQEIEANEGEITSEQNELLRINEGELKVKSVAYLSVIRDKEAFISLIDSEIKRLEALKKQNSTIISKLKDSLLNAVKTFGEFKVGTLTFGSRTSKSVIISNSSSIPAYLTDTKIVITPDKAAIKKAIESGTNVLGCSIQENLNLKIK